VTNNANVAADSFDSLTDDQRVSDIRPLLPPAILMEEIPQTQEQARFVSRTRRAVEDIILGRDQRLLVIVGPCSIHDTAAAMEYAQRLQTFAAQHEKSLLVLMRVYFEKPRTTVGWKGLINDPDLDGSHHINKGLRVARGLLRDVSNLGLGVATEFVDTITPQFYADFISWAAIGARTTESPVHRQLASGLSMAVGFKNGTDGNVRIAVDGVVAAASEHRFLSVTKQGISAIVATRGNPACHVVLRGSATGPNYDRASIVAATAELQKRGLPGRVLVDCSHGNSSKDHERQAQVIADLLAQRQAGASDILGVMLESHLVGGKQDLVEGRKLTYGQSITDACLSWEATARVLGDLAGAMRHG
jgi:3-deoxy-7-phosphoheptulonate synthase